MHSGFINYSTVNGSNNFILRTHIAKQNTWIHTHTHTYAHIHFYLCEGIHENKVLASPLPKPSSNTNLRCLLALVQLLLPWSMSIERHHFGPVEWRNRWTTKTDTKMKGCQHRKGSFTFPKILPHMVMREIHPKIWWLFHHHLFFKYIYVCGTICVAVIRQWGWAAVTWCTYSGHRQFSSLRS